MNEPSYITMEDFGIDLHADEWIIKQFRENKISRVSIVVNGDSIDYALSAVKKYNIPVGLHFNLINGAPLSNADSVSSLLNSKGRFHDLKFFLYLISGRINYSEIELELKHQLEFLKKRNIEISHFNSHYNIHMFKPIWDIVIKAVPKNKVRTWKIVKNNLWKFTKLRLAAFYVLGVFVKIHKGDGELPGESVLHPFWWQNKGSFIEIMQLIEKIRFRKTSDRQETSIS